MKMFKRIAIIAGCVLLVAALLTQQFASRQATLQILEQLEPKTVKYEEMTGKYPSYELWDKDDLFLGYAVHTSASGYGGPISVWVSLKPEGTVKKVVIAENCETPAYLKRVVKENFINDFIGKSAHESFKPGEDLDAVNGATLTAEGIAQAVRKGVRQVGANALNIEAGPETVTTLGWQEWGLLFFYGLVFLGIYRKYNKWRPWVLLGSVVFLGFTLNAALSLQNIAGLVSGNRPSLLERPFWYILTFGVLALTLLGGKNFYCSWLCPFGGLQEGLYKGLGFAKFQVSSRVRLLAQRLRWGIIWVALMAALLLNRPAVAGFEPFAIAFGGDGNIGQWLILCLVLLSCILIYRIWCRFFCPVGAVLDFSAALKRKMKLLFRHQESEDPESYSGCAGFDKTEKAIILVMALYTVLIAVTLLLNMEIL